jgi:hypothetical protein
VRSVVESVVSCCICCANTTPLCPTELLLLLPVPPCTQANEIDAALLDLLQQNIEAARIAGQEEPAKFMEKVRQAAMKFTVTKA